MTFTGLSDILAASSNTARNIIWQSQAIRNTQKSRVEGDTPDWAIYGAAIAITCVIGAVAYRLYKDYQYSKEWQEALKKEEPEQK